jgi:dethiobiotin synthetase
LRSAAEAPRFFVTATDTGVGKTQVASALLSLLADRGLKPAPFKPYESGCSDPARPDDALTLREAARSDDPLELICPHRFKLPLAPGIAAARLRREPDFALTRRSFTAFQQRALVVEGAGGLCVPLDSKREVIDLIGLFALPVILVARAGLGTLNHTSLSLRLLEERGARVRAVVLSRSTAAKDPSERDNPQWLRKKHGVEVLGPVPFTPDPLRRRANFRRVLRAIL